MTEWWVVLLQSVALRAPSLIIGCIGLWFAITRYKRHPRASTYAAIGFAVQLVAVLAFIGTQIWMRSVAGAGGASEVASAVATWNLINYALGSIALATLALAVFVDRAPPREALVELGETAGKPA